MSTSGLEGEDLESVQLVRMEDVQPSREGRIEVLETCIIDHIEYDNECIIDECSTSLPMQTIDAEGISGQEYTYAHEISNETPVENDSLEVTAHTPDRWPTLEILPGGVIKPADKNDNVLKRKPKEMADGQEMIYACAKCPETFKFLFCLVKHVKTHEIEQKSNKTKLVDLFLPKEIQKKDRQTNTPNSTNKKVVIRKITTKRKKVNHKTKRLKI